MDDLISREDALKRLRSIPADLGRRELDDAIKAIENTPSAQPERKGKWLLIDGYRCSCCNYKLQTTGIPSSCPNCGADMRT